ncbi:MAG: hypothetical protein K2J64_06280, partial [Desulfovibrio sp.]|nr:hypothetical protein [Desulfovibrio sp.]
MESSPQVTAGAVGGVWRVSVGGCWNLDIPWPATADAALAGLADQRVTGLTLTTSGLDSWDSSLLVFLVQLVRRARARKLKV